MFIKDFLICSHILRQVWQSFKPCKVLRIYRPMGAQPFLRSIHYEINIIHCVHTNNIKRQGLGEKYCQMDGPLTKT